MLDVIKDLYVLRRKGFIQQVSGGSYITHHYNLHDERLKLHLKGSQTLGLFSGQVLTKFITFDVDNDKKLAMKLVEVLKDIGYLEKDILVSESGSKGYHVELFFEKLEKFSDVSRFYRAVIAKVGCSERDIELRPTPTQGVKLPLSYHRATGKFCGLLETASFELVSDFEDRLDKVSKVELKALTGHSEPSERVKGEVVQYSQKRNELVLRAGTLLYKNSRHNTCCSLLASGVPVDRVKDIVRKTFETRRWLINKKTSLDFALREVDRLSKYYAVDRNSSRSYSLFESDCRAILETFSKHHLRELAFTFLLYSQKYSDKNGVFYISQNTLIKMGADSNKTRLRTNLSKLIEANFIVKVETKHLKPQRYRILTDKSEGFNKVIDVDFKTTITFEAVVAQLLSEETVKSLVSKTNFYTKFKPYYQK